MPRPLLLAAVLMPLLTAVASAADGTEAAESTRLAAGVKDVLRSRCFECHGGAAVQADVDVLDVKRLLANETVVAGKPDDSPLYAAITNPKEDVRMPQDQPALPAGDVDLIRQWILAGAPAFPADVAQPKEPAKEKEFQAVVGIDYVLKEIHRHQRSLPAEDRRFVRYFSSNHLLAAGVTRESLDLQRRALVKALNHLSRERKLVRPEVVNGETATVFAVDLRELGWHAPVLKVVGDDKAGGPAALNRHDLVLLEYPYAIAYEDSATYDALLTEYAEPAGLVRPIPFVRVDWFCSVATLPPLYHDLLGLPRDLATLEAQLGVDSESNINHRRAKRAGMTVSGVSRNNRAVERHPHRDGAYWKSIDYASSKGRENIFTDPIRLEGTGGEMIFNLPNGLQAYYVADAKGHRLDEAPTSIVTDRFAEDKTVRNGLSCIRCHDRGMKDFRDDVRPAVEKISGSGPIHKRDVLALYPPHEEMAGLLKQDRERFQKSLEDLFGGPQREEPLAHVSQNFLDAPLQLGTVAGELGLADTADLKVMVRQPQFTGFGLVSLGSGGVVRRDMWEDYYDQVVRALGLGVPLVPVDGLTRPDYRSQNAHLDVSLSTSKKNNVFAPGDELSILVTNRGKSAVFIELIGTGTGGEKVVMVPGTTKVEPGATFRFPESGALKVQPSLGRELVTLLASETAFPAGRVYRGEHADDRVVHSGGSPNGDMRLRPDAGHLLKHTIAIETR